MEWLLNRSPIGQAIAFFGLGGIFSAAFPRWVWLIVYLVGVGIGLIHHFRKSEQF